MCVKDVLHERTYDKTYIFPWRETVDYIYYDLSRPLSLSGVRACVRVFWFICVQMLGRYCFLMLSMLSLIYMLIQTSV